MAKIQKMADTYLNRREIDAIAYHTTNELCRLARHNRLRYSPLDNLLISCLLRLDRAKVYIQPGVYNCQMGSELLVRKMMKYDYTQVGETGFIKDVKTLKYYTPATVAKTLMILQVMVNAKYGEARGQREDTFAYLFDMLKLLDSPRSREKISSQARKQLNENVKFARGEGLEMAVPYMTMAQDIGVGSLRDMNTALEPQ